MLVFWYLVWNRHGEVLEHVLEITVIALVYSKCKQNFRFCVISAKDYNSAYNNNAESKRATMGVGEAVVAVHPTTIKWA